MGAVSEYNAKMNQQFSAHQARLAMLLELELGEGFKKIKQKFNDNQWEYQNAVCEIGHHGGHGYSQRLTGRMRIRVMPDSYGACKTYTLVEQKDWPIESYPERAKKLADRIRQTSETSRKYRERRDEARAQRKAERQHIDETFPELAELTGVRIRRIRKNSEKYKVEMEVWTKHPSVVTELLELAKRAGGD